MKHQGTKCLETVRLILRPFTREDAPAAFRNWESDPKVTEFLRWKNYDRLEDAEKGIFRWVENYREPSFYQWAIVPKDLNEPIGTISVVGMDERIDMVHIGYCIGSRWWHRGYTSEALSALIPFFFEEVKVNRIESQHDPENPNSGRVMQKCGMKYEGTLRKADWSNRGIVDACVYGMLREEYEGNLELKIQNSEL